MLIPVPKQEILEWNSLGGIFDHMLYILLFFQVQSIFLWKKDIQKKRIVVKGRDVKMYQKKFLLAIL